MIKYLNLSFVVLLLITACSNERETPNGLKFKVLRAGDGIIAKKNQIVVFDFTIKDNKDSVWGGSYENGLPASIQIQDSSRLSKENGMDQMIRMLSKGDSVITTMTMKKFFGDMVHSPIPATIDSTLNISYILSVHEITSPEEFMEQQEAKVMARDTRMIEKYLSENKLTAQKDTSGLQYILYNNGGGRKPSVSNCVQVSYRGKFLQTGQIFDQQESIDFPLGMVIKGWQLGIPMLGVGDSATFFIPSKLGYGRQGYSGAIPPNAVLMFDVKLLGVKDNFDMKTRSCN